MREEEYTKLVRKPFLTLLILILLLNSTALMSPVAASPTALSVIFPNGTNTSIGEHFPPDTFTVNITIAEVIDLYTFEFKLFYKTAVLNATEVTLGSFFPPGSFLMKKEIDDAVGYVWYGVSVPLGSEAGVNGSGTLATVAFTVDDLGATVLYICDTLLGNSPPAGGQAIAHEIYDGHFVNAPVHDVAITSLTPSNTLVKQGQTVNVTVVARNHGNFTESFTVTANANATLIETPTTVTDLAPGSRKNLTFTWDTTDAALGKYIISANATTVSDETDTTDNTYNMTYDFVKKTYVYVIITVKLPVAVFNYSPICPAVNELVTFNASNSTSNGELIKKFQWEFGDGVNDTSISPIYTRVYTAAGTYNVTLTITDSDWLTDTTWKLITVHGLGHDVAVVSVETSATEVLLGQTVNITVVVKNYGNFTETFNVTAFHNDTAIGTPKTVTDLPPCNYETLTFRWNTTGVPLGNYIISANATTVPDETNTDDNTLKDGTITIVEYYTVLHPVEVGGVTFHVITESNSNVSSFEFIRADKKISFNVTRPFGLPPATYFCNVTIPKKLLNANATHPWLVLLDGTNITHTASIVDNVTHTFIYFSYTLSTRKVEIIGATVATPPIAIFTPSTTSTHVDDLITFDASASNDPEGELVSYQWDFDDGTTKIYMKDINLTDTTTHAYGATGTYNVILTVMDNDGLIDSVPEIITITKMDSIISITVSPTSIIVGSSTTISGAISPARAHVTVTIHYKTSGGTWTPLTTATTDSNGQYSYAWTATTVGTHELKASWPGDANTLQAESDVTTLVVKALPVASFTYTPSAPIVGDKVTFNASASTDPDGSIDSWHWDFGDGTYGNGEIVTHTYNTAGDFTVNLTVTDNATLTDTVTKSITITKFSSTVSISVHPTSIAVGKSTSINGSIAPIRAGVTVTIWYRPSEEETWSTLETVATDDNSQYSYDWTPETAGTYKVKASWEGDENTQPSESVTSTIIVNEVPTGIPLYPIAAVGAVAIIASCIAAYYLIKKKP